MILRQFWLLLVLPLTVQAADERPSLPEPLTLDFALQQAAAAVPAVRRAEAGIKAAEAELSSVAADYGLRAGLRLEARRVRPLEGTGSDGQDDSRASVRLRKRLWDFGRSAQREEAAESAIVSASLSQDQIINERRVAILERYFNVLLADLEYVRDNEAMAIAYLRWDRARDRNELGQVSDVEVLEKQSIYEASLLARTASETRQRFTRAQLATVLDRQGQLPSELARPSLPQLQRDLPDFQSLVAVALDNNIRVKAMRAAVEAARGQVEAARQSGGPVLSGEVEANEFALDRINRDRWRAGLTLEIPIYQGGAVQARVAEEMALLHEAEADLYEAERGVKSLMLKHWLALSDAMADRKRIVVLGETRDLKLDLQRARYELEIDSDMGNSMVDISDYRLQKAENEFAIVLAWARLELTMGQAPFGEQTP